MNNQRDVSFLAPILSAISGLGAIAAALSPLLIQNRYISNLFIDDKVVTFSSLVALIVVIIVLWLTSSSSSYQLFEDLTKVNWVRKQALGIIVFVLALVVFYSLKKFYDAKLFGFVFASVMQMFTYVGAFMALAFSTGLLFRDSYSSFQRKRIEDQKMDLIRDALIKAGKIKVEFEIFSYMPYQGQNMPFEYFGSKMIIFGTGGKKYSAIISQNYSDVLDVKEL